MVRYLIVPAAGRGTRMKSGHPDLPKELLSVGGKPALFYSIEEGMSIGVDEVIIIISRDKEGVRQSVEGHSWACDITFLYQEEPLGEMDALNLARESVNDSAFAVVYPDNIYFPAPGALRVLEKTFQTHGEDVTALFRVTADNARGLSDSGRIDFVPLTKDTFRITAIHEKERGAMADVEEGEIRGTGFSIVTPSIFSYIDRVRKGHPKEELTDGVVRRVMLEERPLLGSLVPGTVFDIGNPLGYDLCLTYVSKASQSLEGTKELKGEGGGSLRASD